MKACERLFLTALFAALAAPAFAHGPPPGLQGFVFGLRVPTLLSEQLITTLALGLLLGSLTLRRMGAATAVFLAAFGLALFMLPVAGYPQRLTPALLGAAVALAVTVAAARPPAAWAASGIAGVTGFAIGLAYIPPPAHWLQYAPLTLGACLHLLAVLFAAFALSAWLRAPARKAVFPVALRVLAAWLAAVAVFRLALELKP